MLSTDFEIKFEIIQNTDILITLRTNAENKAAVTSKVGS